MKHNPILLTFFLGFHLTACAELPPVRVVYFQPAGMEMFPDAPARLGRVMQSVQEFYRLGMERNGFGTSTTFALEWEPESPSELKLHVVQGRETREHYGRDDSRKVWAEVEPALRERGIDPSREVVLIFQQLLRWNEDGTATELGPYCGGGGGVSGVAWVFDDPLLDAGRLTSPDPGAFYNGRCSVGQFNSHYIGGVAHELGHAFGLPHDCERPDEHATLGTSLMGSGNHTYGEQLRDPTRLGTFLTRASAARLALHPCFTTEFGADPQMPPGFNLGQVIIPGTWRVEKSDAGITVSGRVAAPELVPHVIVYLDNADIPADYESLTWVTTSDASGDFRVLLEAAELKPGTRYEVRVMLPLRWGLCVQAVAACAWGVD